MMNKNLSITEGPLYDRKDKGFVLLWTLLVAVFLTILVGASLMRSNMQLQVTSQRRALQEAFYTAEAGLERTISELRRNTNWSPGTNGQAAEVDVHLNRIPTDDSSAIGFYSLEVKDGGIYQGWTTRWVRSVGKDSLQGMTRVIVARVIAESPTRFLVSTLGDLRIGSGAAVNADVLAQNIYFDVNAALGSPQKDIHVDGNLFYITSINGQNDPAVYLGQGSKIQKSPSITFAGVDMGRYRNLANNLLSSNQSVYQNGDLTVDLGNLNALSKSQSQQTFAPQLIFAEGNIFISGRYDSSLLVVAGGNVYIKGDITPNTSLAIRPQVGILAKKDLIIANGVVANGADMTIEAFLMADGDGPSAGIFVAQNPKSSLGTLNFSGAMAVRGESRTAIDLNAFTKRIYNYNAALNIDRQIPFLPFIVNVIQWNEKKPQDPFPP